MENNRLQDLIDPFTCELYTTRKIKRYITTRLRTEGEFIVGRRPPDTLGFRQRTYTPISRLLAQWIGFGSDIGERTLALLGGEERPLAAAYSQTAQQLMRKLGWKPGEGIGRRGQGVTDPHLPPGQTSRAGLGAKPAGSRHGQGQPAFAEKVRRYGMWPTRLKGIHRTRLEGLHVHPQDMHRPVSKVCMCAYRRLCALSALRTGSMEKEPWEAGPAWAAWV